MSDDWDFVRFIGDWEDGWWDGDDFPPDLFPPDIRDLINRLLGGDDRTKRRRKISPLVIRGVADQLVAHKRMFKNGRKS